MSYGSLVTSKAIIIKLIAHTLGIPTPKDDIDVVWYGSILERKEYRTHCKPIAKKDVITVTQGICE